MQFGKSAIIVVMYSPKFTITNTLLRNIGTIEASKQVIDHAPLLPFYEKKFQKEALVRAVHHGTHLEGNDLNLTQAEKAMFGEAVMARERDIQEVINYRKVIEYIGSLPENVDVTEELLLKLHRITVEKLLDETRAGAFRTTQVVIKNSTSGEVSFRPPAAVAIPYQLKELLAFISNTTDETLHPVLKSGIVHYEFERIHPFVDGNGRVGRALATLILFREGYDIRRFFSLEEYFDSKAGDYYAALQSVEKNHGDVTEWLVYFTQGLAIELSKIKEKVEHISIDGKVREKLGGKPVLLSERQLAIIEYIQGAGFLQNSAFKQLFPFVSEDTVLNELKGLMQNGIIKKTGKTKAAKYVMV